MIRRKAEAKWNGSGKEGKGAVSTQSGVLENNAYSYKTRFENEKGTNPEELIGAALSGCFSMKLAFVLQAADITADSINTSATVLLDDGAIKDIELQARVKAEGLDKEKLDKMANEAKENCPVSKLLNANISLKADLE